MGQYVSQLIKHYNIYCFLKLSIKFFSFDTKIEAKELNHYNLELESVNLYSGRQGRSHVLLLACSVDAHGAMPDVIEFNMCHNMCMNSAYKVILCSDIGHEPFTLQS